MNEPPLIPEAAPRALHRALALTRIVILTERFLRAFWPLWSIVFAAFAAAAFGLQELLPVALARAALAIVGLLGLAALLAGLRQFRWPGRAAALARLDSRLAGRPLAALDDTQAIGTKDAASVEVWRTHLLRMTERAADARPPPPDLRLATRDPYALRYVALLAAMTALLFGSLWQAGSVVSLLRGAPAGATLAAGPAWEGWVEPPAYTGRASLYLDKIPAGPLRVPVGSRLTLRLYGPPGALGLHQSVSGRNDGESGKAFIARRDGVVEVRGTPGARWDIRVIADRPPAIAAAGPVRSDASGRMHLPFRASDDYGVVAGKARISLDLAAVDRRYGLAVAPEPRAPITLDLPMPYSGARRNFTGDFTEAFGPHPWVGLPVTITLLAVDAAGNETGALPLRAVLPGRHFQDPLAAAINEQRRDLLWSRANAARVAQILRAVTWRPADMAPDPGAYLVIRAAVRRLEAGIAAGLSGAVRDEVAQALWRAALTIEDGNLAGVKARLRRAQERLSEAIRRGAGDKEIARLTEDLRSAMRNYLQQLAEQAGPRSPNESADNGRNSQQITARDLQDMLDRIGRLAREGRSAEAAQLLEQLRQMTENLRIGRGQGARQSPARQALKGLRQTLRAQQGLSDRAFRDFQNQFTPGGEPGQTQPPAGGQGRGAGAGDSAGRDLARQQQQLGDRLARQRRNLPRAGTPEGDAARQALGQAGRAMERAAQALDQQRTADALDAQAAAMEALREGIRNLAAGERAGQPGQRQADGNKPGRGIGRDPLGRQAGTRGASGSDRSLLRGDAANRRARALLEEIRRRSGQSDRPRVERDYLRRLLDQFGQQ